jgi:hypothetical protein
MEDFEEIKGSVAYENGILFIKHFPESELNEETLNSSIALQKRITRGNHYSLLIDVRQNVTVTEEAAELAANNPNSEYVKATAIITDKGINHAGAKFYVSLNEPNIKTQVFLSEEDARKWLAEFN